MLNPVLVTIAAILGGTSVAAGAFGAHALTGLSDRSLQIFETAARYQMYHALAILLVASLARSESQPFLTASALAFLAGIMLFCGSLYALSLGGVKWLGAIAPIGGLALMIGWSCLAIAAWQKS